MRHSLFAAALLTALLPLAAHAQPMVQSQEGIALENQILQLQQQVQQLQSNGGGGNNGGSALGGGGGSSNNSDNNAPAPSPDQGGVVASLLTQVQQLQSQVQQLNGEVDTLQNQVNTQHDATEKEIGDLNFKVTGSATPGAAPSAPGAPQSLNAPQSEAAPTPPPAPQAAAAPSLSGSPHDILHPGLTAYEAHDYATAEAAARAITAKDSSSPEDYRAQFLLAQTLTAEGRPQDAAIAYDSTYNLNRTGTWAPNALLGLASSLAAIGQNEAACDTVSSFNSQFPTPPDGMAPRIQAVAHRAHCS